ncbi:MAG: hypothetical protein A2Y40_10905 [Candidatus Margulisbacteria bacterium GWF2_35_9]|nr:MAG: hypothetical protein A2Y40_10905 [Candidatus Margulisbacteria bacterium GWF2_35_9]
MKKKDFIVYLLLFLIMLFVLIKLTTKTDETPILTVTSMKGSFFLISIYGGEAWVNDIEISPFINIKVTPQIAVWIEDMSGKYLDLIYVTNKTAKQSWKKVPGEAKIDINREEALPYWSHKRGIKNPDGSFMPTEENPIADATTSATPKNDFTIRTRAPKLLSKYRILVEVNIAADFNANYRKNSLSGEPDYTGGKWGSGQPSIIYGVMVDSRSNSTMNSMKVIGHGSIDGTNGLLYKDISKITTGLNIIKEIKVKMEV